MYCASSVVKEAPEDYTRRLRLSGPVELLHYCNEEILDAHSTLHDSGLVMDPDFELDGEAINIVWLPYEYAERVHLHACIGPV